jgi:hypothetical protein
MAAMISEAVATPGSHGNDDARATPASSAVKPGLTAKRARVCRGCEIAGGDDGAGADDDVGTFGGDGFDRREPRARAQRHLEHAHAAFRECGRERGSIVRALEGCNRDHGPCA